MKGLSVLVAIGLLVLAHHLAMRMKRAGSLPAGSELRSPLAATEANTKATPRNASFAL